MFEIIFSLVIFIILLPATLIITTPFVLMSGFFGKNSYSKNVKEGYKKVIKWWDKYAVFIV